MWCSTSPDGFLGSPLELLTTAGNSASSCAKLSAPAAKAATTLEPLRGEAGGGPLSALSAAADAALEPLMVEAGD
jgi:hypothetical protein